MLNTETGVFNVAAVASDRKNKENEKTSVQMIL